MIHRKFKDESMWNNLVTDYLQGLSANQCADRYGVSKPQVLRTLAEKGIKRGCKEAWHIFLKQRFANGGRGNHWQGGRHYEGKTGYIRLTLPDGVTMRREHTLIAEKILGRRLKKGEHVHHINGIKDDNRHCNLLICSNSYHRTLERKMMTLYQKEHFGNL